MKKIGSFAYKMARIILGLVLISNSSIVLAGELQSKELVPVIVLDIDLLGDTTVKSMQAGDTTLTAKFSNEFRRQLKEQKIVDVIDDEKSLAVINAEAKKQYLQRCNGCELHLAKQLGAKQVIVPWVFRMSKLIQTMYVEIRDVETAKLLLHKGLNVRGTTDKGWAHVTRRLVEEIHSFEQTYHSNQN